jgi:DNA gyrase/topoisomerase IV subunit A
MPIKIRDTELTHFAIKQYTVFATYAIEMRATPDFRDGLQAVHRRVLWAMHGLGLRAKREQPVKSARVVGQTLGLYHPHGDSACYGAMVNLAGTKTSSNIAQKLIEGSGNWGSLSDDGFASMRYTEAKLSEFSDRVIFDPFYLPAINMVPNFDGSTVEPEVLPVLLPVLLLNGKFGIAPGVQCSVPCFTLESVKALLAAIYAGEPVTPQLLYKWLRFRTTYGGRAAVNEENKLAIKSFFKSNAGAVEFKSKVDYDAKTKTFTLTRFAVDNITRPIAKIHSLQGVQSAADESKKGDEFATVIVKCSKTCSEADVKRIGNAIEKEFGKRTSFTLNLSHRKFNPTTGGVDISILAPTMVELLTKWIEWRTDLETRACAHWIDTAQRQIDHQKLLVLAVNNREIILKSLDRKDSMPELEAWLAKQLNISVADAHTIYELKIRQLRSLELEEIMATIKEITVRKLALEQRKIKPAAFMLKQLDKL